jgi:hypothetical protein
MARGKRIAAPAAGFEAPVKAETLYRVRVDLSPHETVGNLGAFHLDYCCMPQERAPDGASRRLHTYASGATVAALRKAGRRVEVLADAHAEGRRMQKLLGGGTDRFRGGKQGPEGVGTLV